MGGLIPLSDATTPGSYADAPPLIIVVNVIAFGCLTRRACARYSGQWFPPRSLPGVAGCDSGAMFLHEKLVASSGLWSSCGLRRSRGRTAMGRGRTCCST
jgi:hypothetical protein